MKKIRIQRFLFHNIILLATTFFFTYGNNENAFAESADEHLIKAAMVRNFARFTQWPPESHLTEHKEKDIHLCIMGNDIVENSFCKVKGKKVGNHQITLQKIYNNENLYSCDILFIDVSSGANPNDILKSIRQHPVLTIGETEKFAKAGGIITFFNEANKIRFQINLGAARKAGFKINSGLLQLAVVTGRSHPENKK